MILLLLPHAVQCLALRLVRLVKKRLFIGVKLNNRSKEKIMKI